MPEELRQPFDNLYDFVSGGYWLRIEAVPLMCGWALLFLICVRIFVSRDFPLASKCCLLYFCLPLYHNFAYVILGLRPNEIFGIAGCSLLLLECGKNPMIVRSPIGYTLLSFSVIAFIHASIVGLLYPDLNPSFDILILRTVVIGKVAVLALMVFQLSNLCRNNWDRVLDEITRICVGVGFAGCVIYVLQFGLWNSGIITYGTFSDAGFTGMPSFGSISVERGHFGKLMISLFPFFLISAFSHRRWFELLLFCAVTLLNFSASSLFFFMTYIAIYAWLFRQERFTSRTLTLGYFAVMLIGMSGIAFWNQYLGVFEKILYYGMSGESGGGRSAALVWEYFNVYPCGISYGGSTLRTPPGVSFEINMGLYAFISQFSILAIPLLLGYLVLVFACIQKSGQIQNSNVRKFLIGAVLLTPVVFFVEILWFVPTYWLPLVLTYHSLSANSTHRRETSQRNMAEGLLG